MKSYIAKKLIIYIVLFSSLITLLITSLQLYTEFKYDVKGINQKLEQIKSSYKKSITQSLWVSDFKQLQIILNGITDLPDIEFSKVITSENESITSGLVPTEEIIEYRIDLEYLYNNVLIDIGEFTVTASLAGVYDRLFNRLWIILLSNALKTSFVGIFIYFLFYSLIGRHLNRIVNYIKSNKMIDGSTLTLERNNKSNRRDELDLLVSSVNEQSKLSVKVKESETHLQTLVQTLPDLIWLKDADGVYLSCNKKFERLFGSKEAEIAGKTDYDFVDKELADFFRKNDKQAMAAGEPTRNEEELTYADDGHKEFTETIKTPMYATDGTLIGVLGVGRDITERKVTEEQLNYLAYYDNLTGLPNRRLFTDRLQQSMKEIHRSEKLVAVLFLDLDHFKKINDSLGHEAGDILLKESAQRLVDCIRVTDTLARLGGDEFTLVLSSLQHENDAISIAENILQSFSKPFHVENVELFISVSIGITIYPLDDNNANDLLRNADTAMYHAKDNGRNNFQFYSIKMTEQVENRLKLERELRDALLHNEFVLFYQPKVDTENNTIVGMEALIRWQHPQRGLVAPDDFISAAEETGLIIPIGKWVLEEACKQTQLLNATEIVQVHVSVNLSARQLGDPELPQIIIEILKETKLNPALLDLEITESMLMVDMSKVIQTLKELSVLGITISVDDFGTGHSSLAYLKQFPISTLKIDRSFIRDTPEDKDDMSITIAIIQMAHALGLKSVAEGVETKEQLDFLKQYKCDLIQGYYFSKPIAFNEIVKLFETQQGENKLLSIRPVV